MGETIEDTPNPTRPVVIVQYHRSLASRLTTPILVVITALAVLSHRVKIDDWRGVVGALPEPAPEPNAERAAVARQPVPLAAPSPALRIARAASPSPSQATAPRPLALRPSPSPAAPSAMTLPQSGAETADAWDEIRRVSAMAQAEARDMEALKAQAWAQAQRLAAANRAQAAPTEFTETEESRQDFLESLRRAVSQSEGRRAQVVEDLCRKHGVQLLADRPATGTVSDPELTRAAIRYKVESLRAQGYAEVAILNELVRLESRKRPARSGPKSRGDVLVRAAYQLLAVRTTPGRIDSE